MPGTGKPLVVDSPDPSVGDALEDAPGDAPDDAEVGRFVAAVGARVRATRRARGMPRRVLSGRSGVSQRYLAQLETGTGNISIGRLYRVARALEVPVEGLFPGGADGSPAATDARARRVALVGLRGAGKSTLGARLADALGLPFVELAREIETEAGVASGEVIALYGIDGFRRLEREALERTVARTDAVVLAVAGGLVEAPDTHALLLERFHTVWLRASPEEHMRRVRAQGDERPMAGDPRAIETLRGILEAREAAYARAGAALDTDGLALEASAVELEAVVRAMLGRTA